MEAKSLDKKKKIIVMICFILLGLVALAGIAGAFLMNYNTFAPSKPSILDDGSNIFITTSSNENYRGYRFKFATSTKEITIDSNDNILSVEEIVEAELVVGTRYAISACYLGETEGSSSPYSDEVRWTYMQYLAAPTIQHDITNQKITWQPVENATYYTVYYKDGGELKAQETSECYFDYSDLVGGEKEVFVTAGAINFYYKKSVNSNTLSFNHIYRMKEIESISFNNTTKELTVVALEDIDYLTLYLGEEEGRVVKLLDPISVLSGRYTFSVNISAIYSNGQSIGVAPCPADALSTFVGEITTING